MKKDYMTRLERTARWWLPRQEAQDVIADYRDIVGSPPRPERELLRDLGKPREVVMQLAQPKVYLRWLAVFTVLSACILIPGLSPFGPFWFIWDKCFAGPHDPNFAFPGGPAGHYGPVLALLGAIVALIWSRRQQREEGPRPKAILVFLALLLAWIGAALLLFWTWARDPVTFSEVWGEMPSWIGPDRMVSRSVQTLLSTLEYGGIAMALIGESGLVRARTKDRRWVAVYLLGLAAMLISMESLALLVSMQTPESTLQASWWHPHMQYYLAITVAGLAGAGVSLC